MNAEVRVLEVRDATGMAERSPVETIAIIWMIVPGILVGIRVRRAGGVQSPRALSYLSVTISTTRITVISERVSAITPSCV